MGVGVLVFRMPWLKIRLTTRPREDKSRGGGATMVVVGRRVRSRMFSKCCRSTYSSPALLFYPFPVPGGRVSHPTVPAPRPRPHLMTQFLYTVVVHQAAKVLAPPPPVLEPPVYHSIPHPPPSHFCQASAVLSSAGAASKAAAGPEPGPPKAISGGSSS